MSYRIEPKLEDNRSILEAKRALRLRVSLLRRQRFCCRGSLALFFCLCFSLSFADSPDTTPPTGSILINSGASYTNSYAVSLTLQATDSGSGMGQGAQISFSNNNLTWSAPEPYNTSRAWTLPLLGDVSGNGRIDISDALLISQYLAGLRQLTSEQVALADVNQNGRVDIADALMIKQVLAGLRFAVPGKRIIYAKFKDVAGNWSAAATASIIVDTQAPQITSLSPLDASTLYEGENIQILPMATAAYPAALEYQFSIDGIIKQAWSSQLEYSWQSIAGIHKIKVETKNIAGQDAKEIEICVFRNPISPPN